MHCHVWKDTKLELIFEKQLQEKELKYQKQFRVGRKTADFYLPQQNLLIEVDGCFWHGCKEHKPEAQNEDKFEEKYNYYKEKGFESIRIWEHELIK